MGRLSRKGCVIIYMRPFFTIIIPVYNVAPYLRECLDSVLAQTYADWEAICVDDGSTDISGVVLDEYAGKDKRIRVIRQSNAGVSAARNVGLANVRNKGENAYVAFLDADDVFANDWLAVAAKNLHSGDVDLLRMGLTYFQDGDTIPQIRSCYDVKRYDLPLTVLRWGWTTLLREGWCWVLFLKYSGTPLENGYGFPCGMRMREDNIFALGVLEWARVVLECDYSGYFYRQRGDSAVMKSYKWKDQYRFRRSLRKLWRSAHERLLLLPEYKELEGLYIRNMHMRMCPAWRYSPTHILKAIWRRLSK